MKQATCSNKDKAPALRFWVLAWHRARVDKMICSKETFFEGGKSMKSRGERLGPPADAPGPDPASHPTAAAGDPREAPAPVAWQTASEEPSGGGHGEETPKTSSHLLFLTSLSGCHDNGPLYRAWMGMGQLGTARHSSAHRGHRKPRGPARPALHGTAASHTKHLPAASCSRAMDAQPQKPPPA